MASTATPTSDTVTMREMARCCLVLDMSSSGKSIQGERNAAADEERIVDRGVGAGRKDVLDIRLNRQPVEQDVRIGGFERGLAVAESEGELGRIADTRRLDRKACLGGIREHAGIN